ncbi:hypothetical protein CUMW_262400 [Citrus unshiu]|nr:hypothetical protein CUMW_262400 [Citrus unshiu]
MLRLLLRANQWRLIAAYCLSAVKFFRRLLNLRNDGSVSEGKPKYLLTDLVPCDGKFGFEAFNDILHYIYTGKLKAPPPEVSACVDDACVHVSCPSSVNYVIELMYASAALQMKDRVFLLQHWLLGMVGKALVEDVLPILVAAFHCQLNMLRSYCIQRIAGSNLDNFCLERELPDEVSSEIKSLRVKSNQESEANIAEVDPMHAKIVRRIHKALDSDDVELLKLLLDVSNVTLDDAYALHYAAACCSPKVFKEVLNMDSAGLNLKDARGRTVLHVAARRNEPEVMVTLLSKGACASETTSDGQTAVAICRRMTRRKDYIEASKQGQETNKDRLCIDVLEREMRRNSMSRFPPKKFLDCDWSDAYLLENGTPEEQNRKRARFMELKEVQKAFYKDMAEKIVQETKRVLLSLIVTCREILLEPVLWLCCIIAEELQACIVVFSQCDDLVSTSAHHNT